jgi:hypothetical protein
MHLLNSTTLKLHEFIGRKIPPYAILSHTWDDEEVSFQELQSGLAAEKKGFKKIKECCRIAAEDGFEYAWVDTCCIDKTSSAELSEAINSMFRWYRNAEVCYAFLSDVPSDEDPQEEGSAFRYSRWFTRGWTLQELIAPAHLTFLGSDWEDIGSKLSLQALVSKITKIDPRALTEGSGYLDGWSVAQRMSWASSRVTTRVEDMAYCLMGLFDINMPMLYGEGDKAFIRLQEEIIRNAQDQSIFAWWDKDASMFKGGLLAPGPYSFANSNNVYNSRSALPPGSQRAFSLIGSLIELQFPLLPKGRDFGRDVPWENPEYTPRNCLAILGCIELDSNTSERRVLGLYLQSSRGSNATFERSQTDIVHYISPEEVALAKRRTIYLKKTFFVPSLSENIVWSRTSPINVCIGTTNLAWRQRRISSVQSRVNEYGKWSVFPVHGFRFHFTNGVCFDVQSGSISQRHTLSYDYLLSFIIIFLIINQII